MRYGFLLAALAFFVTAQASAATPAATPAAAPAAHMADPYMSSPFKHYSGPPASRQEAIQRAQSHVDTLEKMSDAEWNAWQQHMQARREAFRERRESHRPGGAPVSPAGASPSAGQAAPSKQ